MIRDSHPPDECVFDESDCAFADEKTIKLNGGLTDEQIQDAVYYHKFRNGQMASLKLVTGEGGSGKDVYCNMVAWKFKTYYPGCKAILDYLPRRPFGKYFLFNTEFMVGQVDKMAAIAKGECADPKKFSGNADKWLSSGGEVILKNSVQYYTEYRRYHYKRLPHTPMGIMLNSEYNIGRHLDTLIMGSTVKMNELDEYSCLPHVKFHVIMRKDTRDPHTFIAKVQWVRWSATEHRFIVLAQYSFPINGAKPRPELGIKPDDWDIRRQTYQPKNDLFCWYDLFNSKNAVALNVSSSLRKEQ